MPLLDQSTKIDPDITVLSGEIIDTRPGYSSTYLLLTKATTRVSLQEGDDSGLSDASAVASGDIIIADDSGVMTGATTTAGTQGNVTDTTTYPVTTQATKTEQVTVDGGILQTATFTDAIDVGNITDTTTYPVTDQDGLTSLITLDGGSAQTITFAGVTTSNVHTSTQIDAQLVGGSAAVVGGQVVVTSDTVGPTSAVAAAAGTGGLTWASAATVNTAAGIASQLDSQIDGASGSVVGGQVVLTSNNYGTLSVILIGTGTTAVTWASAVAGTGGTGAYVLYAGAATANIGYVGKKRYVRAVVVNEAADVTIVNIKGDLLKSPAN